MVLRKQVIQYRKDARRIPSILVIRTVLRQQLYHMPKK